MTAPTPRDHPAEQDHVEFTGWAEANGYSNEHARDNGYDDMREAFTAGMQAARDLAAQEPQAETAKVIIVIEASGSERRYRADGWETTDAGALLVDRLPTENTIIAEYAPGSWLSVRDDDAIADDYAAKALAVALRALKKVWGRSASDDTAHDITADALAELVDLGFE